MIIIAALDDNQKSDFWIPDISAVEESEFKNFIVRAKSSQSVPWSGFNYAFPIIAWCALVIGKHRNAMDSLYLNEN